MHPLSLHHLTAMDATPAELVAHAAAARCDRVTIFTYIPEPYRERYPLVCASNVSDVAQALAAHQVRCHGLEVFGLDAAPDWAGMAEGLDMGAQLGAVLATVHIHCQEADLALDHLLQLEDLAGARGIALGLEFNPFSQCATLEAAVSLVRSARAQGAKLGLLLDSLHAMRSGATLSDVIAASDLMCGMQLSDGPADINPEARWREAISERALPGAGQLPLGALIAAMPEDIVIDVEVPQARAQKSGVSAQKRCQDAIIAARALLNG